MQRLKTNQKILDKAKNGFINQEDLLKKQSEALSGIRVFAEKEFKRDIDPMLLSSLPTSAKEETLSQNQPDDSLDNLESRQKLERLQHRLEMQYIEPWGVGGVSMYELVNRIILRDNHSIFKKRAPNEPVGEIRTAVMGLAIKIMKDKINWF